MASSPSYGERPPLSGFRRSFTAPHRRLSYHERAALDPSDSSADILYSHPAVRIVKFTPPTDSIPPSTSSVPSETDYPVDTVETLPWASTTETTVARGVLVIEKVQGSTNFLKCGDIMHAIMKNSQCWCVDGVSKFVLRIRKFEYYRIELPTSNAQETDKVEGMKNVLMKILRFEVTPCPFKRGFHVDLPESALTPRRKGAWKRKDGTFSSSPLTASSEKPMLRSTRTWKRRAVSDGRVLDQNSSDARADSGYGDSPLKSRSQLHAPAPTDRREDSPSSSNSSDDVNGSKERNPESDDSASDQDDPQASPGTESENDALVSSATNAADTRPSETTDGLESHVPVAGERESDAGPTTSDTSSGTPEDDPMASPRQPDDYPPETAETPVFPDVNATGSCSISATEQGPDTIQSSTIDTLRASDQDQHAQDSINDVQRAEQGDVKQEQIVGDLPLDMTKKDYSGNGAELESGRSMMQHLDRTGSPLHDALSPVSSVDSFHTFASSEEISQPPTVVGGPHSDKTPVAEHYNPLVMHRGQHKRDTSELTVTASSPRSADDDFTSATSAGSPGSDRPFTPPLRKSSLSDSSWGDVATPWSPNSPYGLRQRLSSRRSLSPLSPSSTLFAPQQHQSQGNHLTSAILHKVASVALVKPIEVVVLFVHILARIAGGATVNDLMNGDLFKKPENEPRRNHKRGSSLPDQIDIRDDSDDEDEDDFGIPIRGRTRSGEPTDAKGDGVEAASMMDLD